MTAFHALHADRAGTFAAALDGPYRLIFKAVSASIPDGGTELDATAVELVEIVDYHGR